MAAEAREHGGGVGGTSARAAAWLAWSLAGLSVAMFGTSAALASVTLLAADEAPSGLIGELALFAPLLSFPIVGGLISSRRPENPIGWICLAVGLFWMLIGVQEMYDAYALDTSGRVWTPVLLDAALQWMWVPPVGLLGIYMVLLFPDGRLPSRRWRPFAWFAGALMTMISVGFAFVPGRLVDRPGVRNPLGIEQLAWVEGVAVFVVLLLPLCILVSASSLVFRYRRSRGEVRQQIKWLAFAACLLGVLYFGSLLAQIVIAPESLETEGPPEPLWASIINNLILLAYAGVPIAVGIAVLKHRLYDIEIIINRTLVYAPLTATLALVYAGSVVALQAALRILTGQESTLAIVASTLAIAALFNPLRRWVQALVDRRFYRRKYDAAKTLEAFGSRLREETDLETLSGDLVGVAMRTVQPEHVSLWLRSDTATRSQQSD
ncbi:MAG TPA: hypothetical protein VGV91_07895 [Rubrobacter sp.]|nr:hypothetical protein [Rubrobacter sp.]